MAPWSLCCKVWLVARIGTGMQVVTGSSPAQIDVVLGFVRSQHRLCSSLQTTLNKWMNEWNNKYSVLKVAYTIIAVFIRDIMTVQCIYTLLLLLLITWNRHDKHHELQSCSNDSHHSWQETPLAWAIRTIMTLWEAFIRQRSLYMITL